MTLLMKRHQEMLNTIRYQTELQTVTISSMVSLPSILIPTLGKLPCQAWLHLAVGTDQDIVYLNQWIASQSLQLLSWRGLI